MDSAFAGAGLGAGTDIGGMNFPVPTYYANSPSGVYTDWNGTQHDSGTALRKFVDTLASSPVLAPSTNAGINNLGQYLPVAVADTTSFPGSDYYEVAIVEYTEQMHSDLPKATTLRGYVQIDPLATATGGTSKSAGSNGVLLTQIDGVTPLTMNGKQVYAFEKPHYLGPVILATKGKAVRLKYSNLLPVGSYDPGTGKRNGDLMIPVDKTLPGAGYGSEGPNKPMFTENRAEIHLHGGLTPWISDGTPHQWTVPVGDNQAYYKKGQSFQNVPDMADPGDGSATLYWTNDQSARLMFYHDHTSGLTRLNVYVGEAAGYVLTDPQAEGILANQGALPAEQIPVVIQDKTFVPKDIETQDALWDTSAWGQPGDLWFPHVYETNQDPNQKGGGNAVGRWDWGPWFWPVFPSQFALPSGAYGDVTTTPEAFMDTAVVNGTAYPTMKVKPKAYRLRFLNAANDRFVNLGFYVANDVKRTHNADGTVTDVTHLCDGANGSPAPVANPTGLQNCTEVKMVPAVPTANFPANWPTDNRGGGVPDPTTAGPSFYQIGNEAGLMPKMSEMKPVPVNYDYNRRSVTVLNVSQNQDESQPCFPDCHGLYMGPAERADAVVDFSQYAGKTLILYNDAPAPNPGFDPRIDYFTDQGDQTDAGGSPNTEPGYGPNTRTIMQIQVEADAPAPAFNAAQLATALQTAYKAVQEAPIVGQTAYNAALGTTYGDNYASIFTGSANLPKFYATNLPGAGESLRVNSLALSGGGTGYTFTPPVTLSASPAGAAGQAAAHAIVSNGVVTGVQLDAAGAGYTAAPVVTFGQVPSRVVVTVRGSGYSAAALPAVTLTDSKGVVVTSVIATPTVSAAGQVTAITLAAAGAPQALTAPITATIAAPAAGTQAKASVTMSGAGATAVAVMDLYDVATGEKVLAPSGVATDPSGTTAYDVQNKAIQELFEPFYGRMNATLGVELPFTTALTQTTIPLAYIDPTTETIPQGEVQIWKITHNGVDAHPVHFHLVNVQVVNRVGWDGTIKPPEDNELGWKETVKMNPLEDIVVAVKAVPPKTPFGQPRSVRLDDPSQEVGSSTGFTQVNPVNNTPLLVQNKWENFDNEYVWHCHILGHEENDFMRPFVMDTKQSINAPDAPTALTVAGLNATTVSFTWADPTPATLDVDNKPMNLGNPKNEIGFQIQRSKVTSYDDAGNAVVDANGWETVSTAIANATEGSDDATKLDHNFDYFYRVGAYNAAQQGALKVYANPKTDIVPTVWSSPVLLDYKSLPVATTIYVDAVDASSVGLHWDASPSATSYQVQDGTSAGSLADVGAALPDLNTIVTGLAANTPYFFDVQAKNVKGAASSNVVSATTDALPVAFEPAQAGDVTAASVLLRWTNANPNLGTLAKVEISRDSTVIATLTGAQIKAQDTYSDTTVSANGNYTYTVAVTGANGKVFTSTHTAITGPALTASETHDASSVTLNWAYPANSDATGLTVSITRDGTEVASGLTGVLTWTDSTVAANTDYAYVITVTGAGGTAGATVNVTTAPLAISDLQIQSGTLTAWAATLNWANGNPNAVTFEVVRTPGTTSTTGNTSFADTTLSPASTYAYAVTVVGKDGVQKSAPVSLNVTTPSVAITDLIAVSPVGLTQVDLSWTNLPFSVTSYNIVRCNGTQTLGTCTSGRQTVSVPAGSPWTNFAPAVSAGTTYTYFVQPVVTGHPNLPYSNAKTLTTLRAPGIPSQASPINVLATSMTARWSAATNAVNYTVQQQQCANTLASPCDPNSWSTLAAATTALTQDVTGLTPGTAYSYRLRSNAWGSSGWSAVRTATTLVLPVAVNDTVTATSNTSSNPQVVGFNVRTNDTPVAGTGGVTVTVLGPVTATNGGATATVTCANQGSCAVTMTPVGTTTAQRQASKRGTYVFSYQLTYGGVNSAPATATLTLN